MKQFLIRDLAKPAAGILVALGLAIASSSAQAGVAPPSNPWDEFADGGADAPAAPEFQMITGEPGTIYDGIIGSLGEFDEQTESFDNNDTFGFFFTGGETSFSVSFGAPEFIVLTLFNGDWGVEAQDEGFGGASFGFAGPAGNYFLEVATSLDVDPPFSISSGRVIAPFQTDVPAPAGIGLLGFGLIGLGLWRRRQHA